MSCAGGPDLVTNGLVLCLDAADKQSYNGGTVWRDLSGRDNHFNVVNGAHNSEFKYFDFKGSYGMAKNTSNITLAGDVTYCCITRILNSTNSWRTLTRGYEASSYGDHQVIVQAGAYNIGMYDNSSNGGFNGGVGFLGTNYSQQSLPGYSTNSFDFMVWRFTNNDNPTYDFNVNGNQKGTITNSNARYKMGFGSIGGWHEGSSVPSVGSQFWGDIQFFSVYNRRLTDLEVLQNYKVLKGRLRLT